jgi:hypothetical protein
VIATHQPISVSLGGVKFRARGKNWEAKLRGIILIFCLFLTPRRRQRRRRARLTFDLIPLASLDDENLTPVDPSILTLAAMRRVTVHRAHR